MSNLFSDLHLLVPLLLILGIAVGILVYRVLNGGAASSGFNADQRTSAYADFINAATAIASAQRQNRREQVQEQLQKLADARARICLFGDPPIIRLMSDFWNSGASLQTESEILAFSRLCLEIRKALGVNGNLSLGDVSQFLFSHELKDTRNANFR